MESETLDFFLKQGKSCFKLELYDCGIDIDIESCINVVELFMAGCSMQWSWDEAAMNETGSGF